MEEGKGKIRKAKKNWEVETFEHVNDRKAVVSFYFILFCFGKSLEEFEGAKLFLQILRWNWSWGRG